MGHLRPGAPRSQPRAETFLPATLHQGGKHGFGRPTVERELRRLVWIDEPLDDEVEELRVM